MTTSLPNVSITLIALLWRILIAASTRTFFQPDEFYQSLEIAHHAVFGYGHLTWEWTASPPIRSIVFPSLYVPVYWILKITGWENSHALIVAPKVFQGIIAAITDISTRELARQILGERYADVAFVLSLTSFFHILALGRTLSNSVETSLTTMALCFWPWHSVGNRRQLQYAMGFAALSCLVRPTSAVMWSFLFVELLWRCRANASSLKTLLTVSLTTAILASGFLLFIDSWYFGGLTFTPLNFFLTNLSSVSLFYGRAPWHYYITQGLPILLNICLPLLVDGVWRISAKGLRHERVLLALTVWTVAVYSLLGHKEWRFIHPVLPIMYLISAKSLVDYDHRNGSRKVVNGMKTKTLRGSRIALLLLGVLPGIYTTLFHSSAQVNVMVYLRTLDPSVLRSVGFLMPCHSVPWQVSLHKPELSGGRLWALGCEPPSYGQNLSEYRDQTDIFYASPLGYLKSNFPDYVDPSFPSSPFPSTLPGSNSLIDKWDHRWPSHLVFFGALTGGVEEGFEIKQYLENLGYVEVWTDGNRLEEDRRRRGGVKVWQWQRN